MKTNPFSYSCWLLSKRDYSEKELRDKLKSKEVPEELIEKTILKLKQYNYLNEDRFIESFLRTKKSKSNRALIAGLQAKGISSESSKAALVNLQGEEDRAYDLICKHADMDPDKLFKRLAYRGFSFESIKKALKKRKESE